MGEKNKKEEKKPKIKTKKEEKILIGESFFKKSLMISNYEFVLRVYVFIFVI